MSRFATQLQIVQVPTSRLRSNSRNARTHSRRQIAQIAASIKKFGFNNPILADRDNTVWVGNGRLEAARICGLETVPVVFLEHMTAAEIRAFAIADNRLAELACWDEGVLAIELQELMALAPDLDITLTGFEIPEIDLLLGDVPAAGEEEEEVEAPLLAGPAVSKPGDLWLLGGHRILCGTALDQGTYDHLLEGGKADLVFSDPPYNVRISGHATGKGEIQHREFAMASGEMSEAEFRAFLRRASGLLSENSKPGSIHFICMDWRHIYDLLDVGRGIYELKNICAWVKDNGGMGSLYRSQHELITVFKKPGAIHQNNVQLGAYGRNRTNVWNYPGANSFSRKREEGNLLALHPTVKPVAMVADAILDCSAPGDLVLDNFLGSGSTLIAAEQTRRLCRGIELDPGYIDTAIRRWQKLTGRDAVHAGSKLSFDHLTAEQTGGE